jgi:hypothetical protein
MSRDPNFDSLKELLLEEEVDKRRQLRKQLEDIRLRISKNEKDFSPQVQHMIDSEINTLRETFPDEFGEVITKTIKTQIAESKGEMVNALYPIVGRLIKKYIQKELELLAEKIDEKVNNTTSWEYWKEQIKNYFSGVKSGDKILADSLPPSIEGVFMLEADTGILMGSYTREDTLDKDMIGAMLTAIKSFVEDAFQKGKEQLEWIEYETYKIHLVNLQAFNMAIMISGVPNLEFKGELEETILKYSEAYYKEKDSITSEDDINRLLIDYFQ